MNTNFIKNKRNEKGKILTKIKKKLTELNNLKKKNNFKTSVLLKIKKKNRKRTNFN